MKINLRSDFFSDVKRLFAESGEFKAETFRYSTGVEALKVSNSRGSFTILPFMGQMIWRCDFDGRELAMKSMYAEPKQCIKCFNESYGCFMMHCGLTAMGNPTADDTHVGHAELPIISYKEAYLEFGKDKLGEYVAVGGKAYYDMCFTYNYVFKPRVILRKGAAKIDIIAAVTNIKDLPLKYYYLCHVNHRPVNGAKIVESPLAKKPIINHEVRPTTTSRGRTRRISGWPCWRITTKRSRSSARRASPTSLRLLTATSTRPTKTAGRS